MGRGPARRVRRRRGRGARGTDGDRGGAGPAGPRAGRLLHRAWRSRRPTASGRGATCCGPTASAAPRAGELDRAGVELRGVARGLRRRHGRGHRARPGAASGRARPSRPARAPRSSSSAPTPTCRRRFAPASARTAVAQVERDGLTWFVLARELEGERDYVATPLSAQTGDDIDSFLELATERYADQGGTGVAVSRDSEFSDFVAARRTHLRRVAYACCGDWHRAEDLVQTSLVSSTSRGRGCTATGARRPTPGASSCGPTSTSADGPGGARSPRRRPARRCTEPPTPPPPAARGWRSATSSSPRCRRCRSSSARWSCCGTGWASRSPRRPRSSASPRAP